MTLFWLFNTEKFLCTCARCTEFRHDPNCWLITWAALRLLGKTGPGHYGVLASVRHYSCKRPERKDTCCTNCSPDRRPSSRRWQTNHMSCLPWLQVRERTHQHLLYCICDLKPEELLLWWKGKVELWFRSIFQFGVMTVWFQIVMVLYASSMDANGFESMDFCLSVSPWLRFIQSGCTK